MPLKTINSYIAGLFIFQFGFLQPLSAVLNSQVPIAIFTGILTVLSLYINKFRIHKNVYILLITIFIFFMINLFIYNNRSLEIILYFLEFIIKCFPAVIISSMPVEAKEFYKALTYISIFNFFMIFLFPFVTFLDSMNYMRFGYAMLPTVIMFYYNFKRDSNKLVNLIFLLISLVLLVIYGSRGPLISLVILIALEIFFNKNTSTPKKIFIILMFTAIVIFLNTDALINTINYLYEISNGNSYSLFKYKILIEEGFVQASSGRNIIYMNLINLIKENPIVGQGVGAAQYYTSFTSHNIVLQILIESGFIGIVFWWLFSIFLFEKATESRNDDFNMRIIHLLIAISVGRLLISSDMWLRPEFWFLISYILTNINKRRFNPYIKIRI